MTACNYLTIIVMGLVIFGWSALAYAEDDSSTSSPAAKASTSKKWTDSDDTTPVHKSTHKKKTPKPTADSEASGAGAGSSSVPAPDFVTSPGSKPTASTKKSTSSTKKQTTVAKTPESQSSSKTKLATTTSASSSAKVSSTSPSPTSSPTTALIGSSGSPTVETGLPIARHPAIDGGGPSAPIVIHPATGLKNVSVYPRTSNPISSATISSSSAYANARTMPTTDDFVFATTTSKVKVFYPWKTGIFTTKFWIGEGGSTISPTDNIGSAWDQNWRESNGGTDDPNYRNGYASGSHAPTVNPFYVALPFNDLVYPDKARQWLPPSWYRRPKDGKQVSWCKDRWVQIKNAQGRSCYAQWEDVGPLRSDHAEYVFGNDRPNTYTRAGLDVSPAVAQYLGFDTSAITSWRFVDEEDVRPGEWLKYDELALLYQAMQLQKKSSSPVQRNVDPSDDQSNDDSNKKRVGAAKG